MSTSNTDHKPPIAVQVLQNVWVGGLLASQNKAFFDKENIKAVVNCTATLPNFFNYNADIEYVRLPSYDNKKHRDWYKTYQMFPLGTEFIYKNAVLEEKNVLVHCQLGLQRAPTLVCAYLTKFYDYPSLKAANYLLKKKPDIFHQGNAINFSQSLKKWESKYIEK